MPLPCNNSGLVVLRRVYSFPYYSKGRMEKCLNEHPAPEARAEWNECLKW